MTVPPALKRLLNSERSRVWSWFFLCCVMVFVGTIRFRLREMPLERDEGEYAYAGQLFLQGIAPSKLAYTIKLPGTHAAYAILMLLFGQTSAGVHLGFLTVNCATIVLLYLIGRILTGEIAGCVSAAAFGLMSLSGDVLGTAAHATHFVVFFALAGVLLLLHASSNGKVPAYIGSGFLLSASVLMKHNGILFLAFGVVWLAWLGFSKALGPNRSFVTTAGAFALGAIVPFLLLLMVLWLAGTFHTCWFWSVTYAQAYAKPNPGLMIAWRMLTQRMPEVMTLPFYTAFVGLLLSWLRQSSWPIALFITGFFFSSVAAVVPGFHFRPHYFVVLIPAVALLSGTVVQQATTFVWKSRIKWLAPLPILIVAVFFGKGIAHERELFFRVSPIEASRMLYGHQPFPEAIVLGDYLRANSSPDVRIAVLGSEPEIYFYARRHSATGYIYTYPLIEHQPFALEMQQQMRDEIQAAQPRFIVQVRTWTSWLSRPGSLDRIDKMAEKLMPRDYKVIGTCEVFADQSRVKWNWHPDPEINMTGGSKQLLIFEQTTGETQKARP
jgi:Dolichyl-phosphate-mannose-protein mannosyltransferase